MEILLFVYLEFTDYEHLKENSLFQNSSDSAKEQFIFSGWKTRQLLDHSCSRSFTLLCCIINESNTVWV